VIVPGCRCCPHRANFALLSPCSGSGPRLTDARSLRLHKFLLLGMMHTKGPPTWRLQGVERDPKPRRPVPGGERRGAATPARSMASPVILDPQKGCKQKSPPRGVFGWRPVIPPLRTDPARSRRRDVARSLTESAAAIGALAMLRDQALRPKQARAPKQVRPISPCSKSDRKVPSTRRASSLARLAHRQRQLAEILAVADQDIEGVELDLVPARVQAVEVAPRPK
jgi:hypothetical protein